MSLIGAFAQGAAQPMSQMTNIAMEGAQRDNLMQKELQMREEMAKRLAEYNIAQNKTQGAAIDTEAQGIINANVEQQAQAVSSTPGAGEFVRNEKGATPTETIQAKSDAAGKLGLIDRQKNYDDRLHDMETKDTADNQFKATMKRADAAVTAANRSADKGVEAARLKALGEGVGAVNDRMQRLQVEINTTFDEPTKAALTQQMDSLKALGDRYNTALAGASGLPAEKGAPGLDDLFPAKNKPGAAKPDAGKTPAATPKSEKQAAWVSSTRQGSDVTPYEYKLEALMARQPNRSAPQAEIKRWEAELVNLKASKDRGTINRGM